MSLLSHRASGLFEAGAHPHPPRELYSAYVGQCQIFVGVYGETYGWIAPGADVSGIEDEFRLAEPLPRLIYVKEPVEHRDPRLAGLLDSIRAGGTVSYRRFASPAELRDQVGQDLAVLLSERFEEARRRPPAAEAGLLPTGDLPDPAHRAGRDLAGDQTGTAAAGRGAGLRGAAAVRCVGLHRPGDSVDDETLPIDPATGEPADPVGDALAYWLPPTSRVALAWEWTPGAWAIVAPSGVEVVPSTAELRGIATRVAGQVRFGAGTPVRAPFTLPAPNCMHSALTLTLGGTVDGPRTPVGFNLGFDPPGTAAPTHIAGYVPYLWVNASTSATIDQRPAGATPYPADLGYPAYRSDYRNEGRDSDVLLVFAFSGYGVEIEPRGMKGTRDEKLGYAADIFRTMSVFPGAATDPSAWGDPVTH